jgi:hypothetical protein
VSQDWSDDSGHDECHFFFPQPATGTYAHMSFETTDMNEAYLQAFDAAGQKVMLGIEPSDGNITREIQIVLNQYGHHSCVAGVLIDCEWILPSYYASTSGEPVSDAMAQSWLAAIQTYNPNYLMQLCHWQTANMPPTFRSPYMIFENDGCGDGSEASWIANEVTSWSKAFPNQNVSVSEGYTNDWSWTKALSDPASKLMNDAFSNAPNMVLTYWYGATIPNVYGN